MTPHVLKTYDYLANARHRLFLQARPLTPRQHAEAFPIGLGSLLRTMTHIMICEKYYILRMLGEEVPPYETWPIRDENPPAMPVIEAAWAAQFPWSRSALAAVEDWNSTIAYDGTDEQDRPRRAMVTPADIFTQLVLHEVHHRAQAMNILRYLGVASEDVDYNELAYEWESR